jgi:hypothetical protein
MSDPLQDNDKMNLPSVESVASPFDVPQNNNVLPRNIFTSGVLPGNTVIQVGQNGPLIDGKNKLIGTGDTGQRIIINSGGQLIIYDTSGVARVLLDQGTLIFYDSLGNSTAVLQAELSGIFDILSSKTHFGADVQVDGNENITGKLTVVGANGINITTGILESQGLLIDANGALIKGSVVVDGDISATGSKSFRIEDPLDPKKELVYTCPETPEVLLMCRGNGEVILPDHFTVMTEPDTLQTIKDAENGNWLVTGIRKGYKDFNPEQDKKS